MLCEMTAEALEASCPTYVMLKTRDMPKTKLLLSAAFSRVEEDEKGYLRVYDLTTVEAIVTFLYEHGVLVAEIGKAKISLEEYYIDLMKKGRK